MAPRLKDGSKGRAGVVEEGIQMWLGEGNMRDSCGNNSSVS